MKKRMTLNEYVMLRRIALMESFVVAVEALSKATGQNSIKLTETILKITDDRMAQMPEKDYKERRKELEESDKRLLKDVNCKLQSLNIANYKTK